MIEQLDSLLDEPFKFRDGQRYLPFTYYPAPCKVPKEFKRELAKIGGRTPDGRPILRCQWGMDITWLRAVRETSGEYVMRRVPRYVMSRDLVEREEQTSAGVWHVKQTGRFFGDPYFYIEEWKPAEHFCAPGVSIDAAEEMWEAQRYKVEETDYEQPPAQFKNPDEVKEYQDAMQRHRVILVGDGKGNVINGRIDLMGPFPRSGRYEYLTKLRPAGAEPNGEWLEIVRETYWRRKHRTRADVDEELEDLNIQMATQRSKARLNQTLELENNLYLHWRSEAETGEAPREFVRGYKPEPKEGASV